jgi:hypothetical protein
MLARATRFYRRAAPASIPECTYTSMVRTPGNVKTPLPLSDCFSACHFLTIQPTASQSAKAGTAPRPSRQSRFRTAASVLSFCTGGRSPRSEYSRMHRRSDCFKPFCPLSSGTNSALCAVTVADPFTLPSPLAAESPYKLLWTASSPRWARGGESERSKQPRRASSRQHFAEGDESRLSPKLQNQDRARYAVIRHA